MIFYIMGSYVNTVKFKLDKDTYVTRGYLVDYKKSSSRNSTWSGIYEYNVNEKEYYCIPLKSSFFKFMIKEEIDIYYNQSNPDINKAYSDGYIELSTAGIFILIDVLFILARRYGFKI